MITPENWGRLCQVYARALPADQIRFDHHWAKVSLDTEWKSLLKVVRIPDVLQVEGYNDKMSPVHSVMGFLKYNNGMAMIYPLGFLGVATGMALRAIHQKEMATFVRNDDSACFTASHFFQPGIAASFTYRTPVIVVEGFADAEAVGRYYPYVIASMGGPVKLGIIPMLRRSVARVFTMMDNDKPGQKAAKTLGERLQKFGVTVAPIKFPEKYKDPAEFYLGDSEAMYRQLRSVLGSVIKRG
jgi:hypothetical protein